MIILHGDNIIASRQELSVLKEKNKDKEIVILDGKNLSLTAIKEAVETNSLFGKAKLVIIENGLKLKKGKRTSPEVEYLIDSSNEPFLLLWEDRELSKTLLIKFTSAKNYLFKLPKLIFNFLDQIKPNNSNFLITTFRTLLLTTPAELILTMMIRQIRLLILAKENYQDYPADFNKIMPWQKQRLTNQAKFFSMDTLIKIYHSLLEIDYKNKTGQSVFNLAHALEIKLTEI